MTKESELRICSKCSCKMESGFCIKGGIKYYCSVECLQTGMTVYEFIELLDDSECETNWMEWN